MRSGGSPLAQGRVNRPRVLEQGQVAAARDDHEFAARDTLVHLAGGILGLGAVALWPAAGFRRITRPVAIRIAAIYWHFMGVLWLGLFLLLMLWR